jgi:tetratricopeptide (TPR) repeat protein
MRGIAGSLTGLGVIARNQGEFEQARAYHEEALEVSRRSHDQTGIAGALLDLGIISHLEGAADAAAPLFEESLEHFRAMRYAAGEATALQWLGVVAMTASRLDEAKTFFDESLSHWKALGNLQMTATDLANLGEIYQLRGALDDAETCYQEALALYETINDPAGHGFISGLLGRLALQRGNPNVAADLVLEGLRLAWHAGDRGGAADMLDALAEAAVELDDLDWAARAFHASEQLRLETGFRRLPAYEPQYETVRGKVTGREVPEMELEGAVRWAMSRSTEMPPRFSQSDPKIILQGA